MHAQLKRKNTFTFTICDMTTVKLISLTYVLHLQVKNNSFSFFCSPTITKTQSVLPTRYRSILERILPRRTLKCWGRKCDTKSEEDFLVKFFITQGPWLEAINDTFFWVSQCFGSKTRWITLNSWDSIVEKIIVRIWKQYHTFLKSSLRSLKKSSVPKFLCTVHAKDSNFIYREICVS